jgi:hypothetical protein
MNNKEFKSELILKIHRVLNEDTKGWMPAIEDVASHDIDPMWVAGVAYLIIDRYVSSVKESKQNKFYEDVLTWFNTMAKNSSTTEYIEKMNLPKSED